MGRASLIIVTGFIFAFGYMNYSLTHTSSSIVNNYSNTYERAAAQNATNSGIQFYIEKLANDADHTVPRSEPYPLTLNLNNDNITTDVHVQKLTAVKPDTFRVAARTYYGSLKEDGSGGSYRDSIVAWAIVTPVEFDFPPIYAAVRTFDSVATFDFAGSPTKVHGQDTDTTGLLHAGGTTLPAFTVTNAADSVRLNAAITKTGIITGLGNPPIAVEKPGQVFDVYGYVDKVIAMANQTLTQTSITGSTADLGTVTSPKITVLAPIQTNPSVNPEVKISGNVTGAGVLIVKADLWVSGTINFKGLVLVVGNRMIQFESTGTPQIFGAMMIAGKLLDFVSKGNGDIYYSSQALSLIKDKINSGLMRTVAWWE